MKSLVPYWSGHSGQLSMSGEDQGQKGPSCSCWVWSIGRQAGPSTPSGQDVSCTEEESPPESPFGAGSRHLVQGLKLGSRLTLGNELSEETHVLTKQEISLGKGTRVESRRLREPRRTALPRGSQSQVLW